jgi:hypothetical protein
MTVVTVCIVRGRDVVGMVEFVIPHRAADGLIVEAGRRPDRFAIGRQGVAATGLAAIVPPSPSASSTASPSAPAPARTTVILPTGRRVGVATRGVEVVTRVVVFRGGAYRAVVEIVRFATRRARLIRASGRPLATRSVIVVSPLAAGLGFAAFVAGFVDRPLAPRLQGLRGTRLGRAGGRSRGWRRGTLDAEVGGEAIPVAGHGLGLGTHRGLRPGGRLLRLGCRARLRRLRGGGGSERVGEGGPGIVGLVVGHDAFQKVGGGAWAPVGAARTAGGGRARIRRIHESPAGRQARAARPGFARPWVRVGSVAGARGHGPGRRPEIVRIMLPLSATSKSGR